MPGVTSVIQQAEGLQDQQAIAGVDPSQLEAAGLLEQLARSGELGATGALDFSSQFFGGGGLSGLNTLEQAAQGEFLGRNQGLIDQTVLNEQETSADRIRRLTAGAGRGRSPAELGILTRELEKIRLDAELGEAERGQREQLDAARSLFGAAPGFQQSLSQTQQAATFPAGLLQQAGLLKREAVQAELDDPLARIQRQQNVLFPAAQLGGTTTGTAFGQQVNQANPVTQGINLLNTLASFRTPVKP